MLQDQCGLRAVWKAMLWRLPTHTKKKRNETEPPPLKPVLHLSLSPHTKPMPTLPHLMYCDTQRNPSPYPMRRTTEHMKISIGRTPASLRSTRPLPVV